MNEAGSYVCTVTDDIGTLRTVIFNVTEKPSDFVIENGVLKKQRPRRRYP